MANSKAITAQDLLCEEGEYTRRYSGTRDELVAAGLARPGEVPGDPGAPIYSHSVRRDGRRFHFTIHSRIATPNKFWVRVTDLARVAQARARAKQSEEPSKAEIERKQRYDAINRAIDTGEDLAVVRYDWPTVTEWIGKNEDLIATGVCEERHFPISPKRTARGRDDGRPGIDWWTTDAIRRGYFRHRVHWDPESLKARPADPKPKLREDDADALSDRCERWFMTMRDVVVNMMSGVGYTEDSVRYPKATVDKVGASLDHARQLLQSSAPITPRPSAEPAKKMDDPAFQSFMKASLIAPPAPQKRRFSR
jgi:hypothetical protein